jgi:hypothetical protein
MSITARRVTAAGKDYSIAMSKVKLPETIDGWRFTIDHAVL